jgi:hypothetical protein
MTDLKNFLDAVAAMRAAQKLEMDALPTNFKVWKKTRQQMTVARLEEKVDALLVELRAAQDESPRHKNQRNDIWTNSCKPRLTKRKKV